MIKNILSRIKNTTISTDKNSKEYSTGVLYKSAVEEEKEWRKENKKDAFTADKLLAEIRGLGYDYKYIADITHRNNTDKDILDIVLKYIGCFDDQAISDLLVGVVGQNGNVSATETLIDCYTNRTKNKQISSFFYDNAFSRIKDKRFIPFYLKLLKNPTEASVFPLTMIMLGRWRVMEAKPYFGQYLKCSEEKNNLLFISIHALSYYSDEDGSIAKEIEKRIKSDDKDIATAAQKAKKRLDKNNY